MVFDLSKLNGRIVEKFGTREKFAETVGMTPGQMYPRLQGVTYFRADEIAIAAEALDILPEEIPAYFFKPKIDLSNQEGQSP